MSRGVTASVPALCERETLLSKLAPMGDGLVSHPPSPFKASKKYSNKHSFGGLLTLDRGN